MYQSNKIRQRRSKNQPPPAKVLEKLKLNHVDTKTKINSTSFFMKISWLFHIFLFITSICVGFLGFSYFIRPKSSDNTFVPFGSIRNFPVYDLFDGTNPNFWSSLIPGHYFGLRAAKPNSTIVSMMWFRQRIIPNQGLLIRHQCRQEDNLRKYSWIYNDFRSFGHQNIEDHNLHLNTSFLRVSADYSIARIKIKDVFKRNELHSLILYAATEDDQDNMTVLGSPSEIPFMPIFSIRISSKNLGELRLNFKIQQGDIILKQSLQTHSRLDRLEETIRENLFFYKYHNQTLFVISNSDDINGNNQKINFIAYQVIFNDSMTIDLEILSNQSQSPFNFEDYEIELDRRQQNFNKEFSRKFSLDSFDKNVIDFARITLSSAIGSIGYFYGYSLVDSNRIKEARNYGPIQLLTVCPSRSVFPRGFLWDEGFHQLLISRWDPKLSMMIIKSWFSLMNEDGWIPREVILGDEAISRVPQEFLVQHSNVANPPSLLFAIESLIDSETFDQQWLKEIYPRLHRWFDWFNTTQSGHKPFTFRWRGRNATTKMELNPKTLASGFDDYPRATNPTDDEIHLDLHCWIALASRLMSKISKKLGENDVFEDYYEILSNNQLLEKLYWSDRYSMFCDKGLHSTNVILRRMHNKDQTWFERQIITEPEYDCVPEFGYVSLFPFIVTILEPNNPKLLKILERIQNTEVLWTNYGLRSLSKKSSYYLRYNTEHDGPYWRGSIWINMNYMVLNALKYYSLIQGPFKDISKSLHSRLKTNLVNALYTEYKRSGFIWEQYNDTNGHGRGAHPFTGWSSLIVQIISN
ncbi:arrestin domain-containing protein 2 [Sarcoptes scabiei]|nr:arrestin domain-containing protein 2 [Sarcoptes scabiei]